jgi:hypothetical protein
MAQVLHIVAFSTKSWLECPSELNDEPRKVVIGNVIYLLSGFVVTVLF